MAVRAGPAGPLLMVMRYRRAVEKLRVLAEACESVRNWPPEDPFLLEAYVFRAVLESAADRRGHAGIAEIVGDDQRPAPQPVRRLVTACGTG